MQIGGGDIVGAEVECSQQVKIRRIQPRFRNAERVDAEAGAEREAVDHKLDVKGGAQAGFHFGDGFRREALGLQRRMVDARGAAQAAMAHGIVDDGADFAFAIAQCAQGQWHGAVDDLEIAATGQLLEFHQRKIRLDAGGVAIHHQADGAGGCDHTHLGISETVLLAQRQGAIPARLRRRQQVGIGAIGHIQRQRQGVERFIADALAQGGAAMVADHPQHRLGIAGMAGEGAQFGRHLGRSGIGSAGHQRRDGAAHGAAGIRIVGQAAAHQQGAKIGVTQAQGAEFIRQFGNFAARELRHQHADFQRDGPQAAGMGKTIGIEAAIGATEAHQVQRGQVAGRIVQEHVFRTGVGRIDAAILGAGMPVVDCAVILQAGIGRSPGGLADLVPQSPRRQGLGRLAIGAAGQGPIRIRFHGAQEIVAHTHGIVGILARDSEISLAIPIGVIGAEINLGVTLLGELDHALHIVFRDHRGTGGANFAAQRGILLRVGAFAAGFQHQIEMLPRQLRACHQGGHLLLLDHLPVDEGFDIRMVDIADHHLGGAACGAAGFDRTGSAVADLEETHQAGGFAAAGQFFILAAHAREIRAGAGAVFEQPRLAGPQIHDAALVHEVVGHRLDEAGMRLRMLVGRTGFHQFAGAVIHIMMALGRAVDAIGPMQPGIEPLRRIRRADLGRQHVAHFVEIGAGIIFRIEITALPAPIGPGAGQTVKNLAGSAFLAETLGLGQFGQRRLVRLLAPQPGRHIRLLHRLQRGRHPGAAEIFLRQHIGGHLRPAGGHFQFVEPEHHRAIRIADFAGGEAEFDPVISRGALIGEMPLNAHPVTLLDSKKCPRNQALEVRKILYLVACRLAWPKSRGWLGRGSIRYWNDNAIFSPCRSC